MPATDATLAWAIQVNVLDLAVNLQAYAQTTSEIETLRLCNRYGQEPEAYITTLPIELVAMIEDELRAKERKESRLALHREWDGNARCWQLKCEPEDHLTNVEYQDHFHKAEEEAASAYPTISEDDVFLEYLNEHTSAWLPEHGRRRESWDRLVGAPSNHHRGIFSTHKWLIRKHFGIDIWTSHMRNRVDSSSYWYFYSSHQPDTTIAYLILAGVADESHEDVYNLNPDERKKNANKTKRPRVESAMTVPIIVPQPLSQRSRARFERIMETLDLEPYAHPLQCYRPIGSKDDGSGQGVYLDQEWVEPTQEPQLTMLVRNHGWHFQEGWS